MGSNALLPAPNLRFNQENLERPGRFDDFLLNGFRPLRFELERSLCFEANPLSNSAERRWYSARLAPCAATMCMGRPNGTF
jgi:hypothetical protein